MIGVVSKPGQSSVVEEFFQLFKTPWEPYHEGRSYDVILATAGVIPHPEPRLLLLYGESVECREFRIQSTVPSPGSPVDLTYQGARIPIYGKVLTFEAAAGSEPCVLTPSGIAGLKLHRAGKTVIRIGYDLFHEAEHILRRGQPAEYAPIPTLEFHIKMLRDWILDAGISLLEIPPAPAGYDLAVCLTHDVDFAGIRNHVFDRTMWGFLYRSTLEACSDYVRGRISLARLIKSWRAALSLPFVYLGWTRDFWLCFDWYLRLEEGLPATYFFIPFKRRAGAKISAEQSKRRAASYDIMDIPEWITRLVTAGCEIGVHGIDAWHDAERGREERERIAAASSRDAIGIRMHWLLSDEDSACAIEEAGYVYDSTAGYNETVGYRSGTTQAYRPLNAGKLLELPILIQDGALFFSRRLGLTEPEAWKRCQELIQNAVRLGGVLNVIWHDRSPGPERFWGEFYAKLIRDLKTYKAWFGTAMQVVRWFQHRRDVSFEPAEFPDGGGGIKIRQTGERIDPPLALRIHGPLPGKPEPQPGTNHPRAFLDLPLVGGEDVVLGWPLEIRSGLRPFRVSKAPDGQAERDGHAKQQEPHDPR